MNVHGDRSTAWHRGDRAAARAALPRVHGAVAAFFSSVFTGAGREPRPVSGPLEHESLAGPVSRSLRDPGVLILRGEIDATVLGAVARQVGVSPFELPGAIPAVHTVDASAMTFADSRVLVLLAGMAGTVRATGRGSLRIVGAGPTLLRMIDLVGLSEQLTLVGPSELTPDGDHRDPAIPSRAACTCSSHPGRAPEAPVGKVYDMVAVAGIPFDLQSSEPWDWQVHDRALSAIAKDNSDVFIDPAGDGGVEDANLSAVRLLGPAPSGDFVFSARVRVEFASTFDAGVLLLWFDETHWAKLCFEFSPEGQPMVVSVVARDVADDANGMPISDDHVWLRIARKGQAWVFHSSTDGTTWSFARAFALDAPALPPQIGFEVQSPTGPGCEVEFTEVLFEQRSLADLRDGS